MDGSTFNLAGATPVHEPTWPPEAGQQICTVKLTPQGYRVVVMRVAIASKTDVMLTTGKTRELADCFPYTLSGFAACKRLCNKREDHRRAFNWPPLPTK